MRDDEAAPLVDGARTLGLTLTDAQVAQLLRYRHELLEWNARFNLTAITAPALVLTRHFLDALTVALALAPHDLARPLRIVDVGAGAGLPGLALKVALPGWCLTELESVGKKARFIAHVVEALELEDVAVVTGRAEELARDPAHREQYDLCVARGVAPLRVLAEYTLPFCKVGGLAVAMKKGDIGTEVDQARRAIGQVGGRLEAPIAVPELPDLGRDRVLVRLRKERSTRADLPRAAGVPAKRPL